MIGSALMFVKRGTVMLVSVLKQIYGFLFYFFSRPGVKGRRLTRHFLTAVRA
jgi:hypothetical protein